MRTQPTLHHRRGLGLIELLLGIGVIVVLFWIVTSSLSTGGTGGTGGQSVQQEARSMYATLNLREVHRGMFMYGQAHDDQYPSTRTDPTMQSDTTSEVFRSLISEGYVVGQQLISPNETDGYMSIGNASSFGPQNTSYALEDYDADNWLRERHWRAVTDPTYLILSDRWIDDPQNPGLNSNQETYWNLLFNDGHGDTTETAVVNGDAIFEYDADFRDRDFLMVHD